MFLTAANKLKSLNLKLRGNKHITVIYKLTCIIEISRCITNEEDKAKGNLVQVV